MQEYGTIKKTGFILGLVVFAILATVPAPEGMEPAAMKVAAVTALMAIFWITEALPIPATALMPIILYPVLGVMKTGAVTTNYANSTIFLFMGGFFIAVAMERWNLHKRIALHTIRAVGASPSLMILGFMLSTAFISMWVSNTATAMMMVPIGIAVVTQVTGHTSQQMRSGEGGKFELNFGKSLMLGIAYAASIGGIATIIGTPPNTIMVGMMDTLYGVKIDFAQWVMFGLPFSIIMLATTWVILTKFTFPTGGLKLAEGREVIEREIKEMGKITYQEKVVLAVFVLAGALWVGGSFIPKAYKFFDDTTVAMFAAMLLFMAPSNLKKGEFVLDWKTAVKIPWDIVLLFGGGFAIAGGFSKTGLAKWISQQLTSLEGVSILIFVLIATLLVVYLTEITSNTATATLLVPIMGSAAIAMGVHPFATIISSCVAASCAFMLPVATPPNAVAFGSGTLKISDMVRAGMWLNIIGTFVIVLFVVYLLPILWGVDLNSVPDWAVGK